MILRCVVINPVLKVIRAILPASSSARSQNSRSPSACSESASWRSRLSRLAGVDQVELGVQGQGAFEQCLRALGSAELQLDHSGVKIQKSIFRAEGECLLYSIGGLGDAPILEKHPRQDVPRVDIMANFQLLLRQLHRLFWLEVVIGIKKRQFAVEQPLVERIECADELQELKLFVCIVGTAHLHVEVVERRGEGRVRHHRNGLLIKCDRFRISFLRRSDLTQARQVAVGIWFNGQPGPVSLLRTDEVSALEADLAKLVLAPSNIFRGQMQGHGDRDRRAHQLDRARGVALEKAQVGHAAVSLVGQRV